MLNHLVTDMPCNCSFCRLNLSRWSVTVKQGQLDLVEFINSIPRGSNVF